MGIPAFNKRGTLDKGMHVCTSEEFYDRFCAANSSRLAYRKVLEQLFALAISRNSQSVIVGGSFITNKPEPNDLDCIMIVPNEQCYTLQTNELLCVNDCELDVLVLSEDRKDTVYSFLNMFGKNRYGVEVGLVEIQLDNDQDKSTWSDYEDYCSAEALFEAREAYINRHVIKGVGSKKILVTIGNCKAYTYWNYDIAPIVSSSGWIFAPFIYDNKDIEKSSIRFAEWLTDIYAKYQNDICVYADGLGTYILGSYIFESKLPFKALFDRIVLTNSVLNQNINWKSEIQGRKVKTVINIINSGQSQLQEKIPTMIKKSQLLGESYMKGFHNEENILNYTYPYTVPISETNFQNTILPIFHMSSIIKKNIDQVLLENIDEILNTDTRVSSMNLRN